MFLNLLMVRPDLKPKVPIRVMGVCWSSIEMV